MHARALVSPLAKQKTTVRIKMLGFGSNSTAGIPTNTDAKKYKNVHDMLSGQRMSKVLKLKNGEQIGYAEVGDRNGIPCIWFTGPCSNRFIIALYNDICIAMGIRLIAFDRPGRGASTPLRYPKDWSFATWGCKHFSLLVLIRSLH
jgi:hypothetical protein